MNREEAQEVLNKAIQTMAEHFDAVQILASWNEDGETRFSSDGMGNYHARQGMARQFIEWERAQILATQIARQLER